MTARLEVAMLGPSGAGKTSLLASMYAKFGAVTRDTGLVLAADDASTSAELSKYRGELEELGRSLVVREPGIEGTRAFREHNFTLRHQAVKDTQVPLRFSDYPGGWVTSGEPTLQARLDKTDILLVAVDTPALVHEDGRWHHHFNHPQRVRDMLADWSQKKRRMLLALVPLKCERWTPDEASAIALSKQVYEAYKDDLEPVRASNNVGRLVVCPVQTVGSLHFNHYQVTRGEPVAQYQGRPNAVYSPKWTAEPLRLVVEAALQKRERERSLFESVFEWFSGDARGLRTAMDTLVEAGHAPSYEPWA